ncbi:MAG: hypothetical protein NVS3B12_14350 [Acidimicrobiales bacterium]
MKQFSCGDVVPGCAAVFSAPDNDTLLSQVTEHARRDHGLIEIPLDLQAAITAHIVSAAS